MSNQLVDRPIRATAFRAWADRDPLIDWLDLYGPARGFSPDPPDDERLSLGTFLLGQGRLFEAGVLGQLAARWPIVRVAEHPTDLDDPAAQAQVSALMTRGVPIISQAPLLSRSFGAAGIADLLIRADLLASIFPNDPLDPGARAADESTPQYRVIDIKFTTLHLGVSGAALFSDHRAATLQVSVYTAALAELSGRESPGYLLGRTWEQGSGASKRRGTGCLERLARIDLEVPSGPDEITNGDLLREAVDWRRRLTSEGANWTPAPHPSGSELRPNMKNSQDAPWHTVKAALAAGSAELTLLPGVGVDLRNAALVRGLEGWTDPAVSAASLGVAPRYAARTEAVLEVNRSDGPAVRPARLIRAGEEWRHPAPLELYVDFETVSNLGDDFTRLPAVGGEALIFQIGTGRLESGAWQFEQLTVDRLNGSSEAIMLEAWIANLEQKRAERGLEWSDLRLIHWSPAETSTLETAYNAARVRQQGAWPELPFFDALKLVIHPDPVVVRGAFGFGLKAIARAMHAAGLIETIWADGPLDGLGAMVGAFTADRLAATRGCRLVDIETIREIGRYNEIDCRTMAEILAYLRAHH